MRKAVLGFLRMFLILFFLLPGCGRESVSGRIAGEFGLELPKEISLEYEDTHGGFHGDGYLLARAELAEEDYEDVLRQVRELGWRELPLAEEPRLLIYGGDYESEDKDSVHTEGITRVVELPEVEAGYWVFHDRQDRERDTYYLYRASWNFSYAMLDMEERTLYYLEFDS